MKEITDNLKEIRKKIIHRQKERLLNLTEKLENFLDEEAPPGEEEPRDQTVTLRISEKLLTWIKNRGKISEVIREILEKEMVREFRFRIKFSEFSQFLSLFSEKEGKPFAPETEEEILKVFQLWGSRFSLGGDLFALKRDSEGFLIKASLQWMDDFLHFIGAR